jgi:hypothetical protein
MTFNNPYDKPFRLLSIAHTNQAVSLTWESVPGLVYRVDASSNLTVWSTVASNLVAAGATYTLATNAISNPQFFRVYRVP